jgi:hypothetical protein
MGLKMGLKNGSKLAPNASVHWTFNAFPLKSSTIDYENLTYAAFATFIDRRFCLKITIVKILMFTNVYIRARVARGRSIDRILSA